MKRIKIVYEYDGTAFCGSQSQKNGPTVQDAVEDALERALNERVRLFPSGRTDAGVSAENQTAHFDTESGIPPEKIYLAVNAYLPPAVRVKHSGEVSPAFHARFDAKKKTYVYHMYLSDVDSPLRPRFTRIDPRAELDKMAAACGEFVGEHDFSAFMAAGSKVSSTVRTVFDCHLETGGDQALLYITADGFLYNMVRIIAGTLIELGCGKPRDIREILDSRDRSRAGHTAPANGLALKEVFY